MRKREKMNDVILVNLTKHTKLIAHRGLSGLAPENSLEAFTLAGEYGYYGVECDIHVSKDNHWIVFHDLSLQRMAGLNYLIKDLTLEEIRKINLISGNGIEKYEKVRIPVLEEYLDICIKYNMVPVIEIKSIISMENLDHLLAILESKGLKYKAHIISFHFEYLIYLRNIDPQLIIFYLVDDIKEKDIKLCKTYFMNINANCFKLTQERIIECHRHNLLVNTYTVDDYRLAYLFNVVNIDFITTNILCSK